jgi:hypothetical protein
MEVMNQKRIAHASPARSIRRLECERTLCPLAVPTLHDIVILQSSRSDCSDASNASRALTDSIAASGTWCRCRTHAAHDQRRGRGETRGPDWKLP